MVPLIISLVICGCILQGVFIAFERDKKYIGAVIFKGLASTVFCLIGFCGFRYMADKNLQQLVQNQARLIFIGLLLGALGDILLNLRWVFKKENQIIFLAGIAAFLAGHIVYMASLISVSESALVCAICGVVLTAILLVIMYRSLKLKVSFMIFGILYVGAVCLMTSFAIGNCITDYNIYTLMYAAGALFFWASDLILIFNTFGKEFRFSVEIVNLSLYYVGQLLIASSLFFIR